MIYGVVGKGGSGKSTVAAALTRAAVRAGKRVLAIDADHNIDFAYNLGATAFPRPLHQGMSQAKSHVGDTSKSVEDLLLGSAALSFSLSPLDSFTQHYSLPLSEHIRLMMTGEQSEQVLYGESCFHTLASVLKLYLPLLEVPDTHAVIVDEKASVDAVSTGIPTGFDLALIVVEPKPHSVRAGKEIESLLAWYSVPSAIIANKITAPDTVQKIAAQFISPLIASLTFSAEPTIDFLLLEKHALSVSKKNNSRLERSRAKYARNKTHAGR